MQYFQPGTTYKYYQSGDDQRKSPRDAVWTTVNVGGWLESAQDTAYSADGQVTAQASYARPTGGTPWYQLAEQKILNGTLTVADEETVPSPLPAPGSANFGQLSLASATTQQSYDAEGNLTGYSYTVPNQFTATYTVSYLKRDGYLEQATAGSSSTTGYTPATDTSLYDTLGQRIAVQQTEQLSSGTVSSTTRVYSYDGDGQILGRTDGTVSGSGSSATFTALAGATTANPDALAPQHYVYAEGHDIATLGANGTIQLSDGLSAPAAAASSNDYTVQAGDTLQSIAQTVYGNASLWYVIADANAISLDSSGNAINLVAGTTLKLPAVSNEQNGSQTFDPYNPLKLIGSTTPALAYIPPPPSQHCNTLSEIIVVAVTALVTYETMGWAAGANLSLGLSTTAGSAALGGFVGSAAGQLTGDALGVSAGFSLGQALTQGLANGLTAGLTSGLQTSDLGALEQGGKLTTLGNLAAGAGSDAAGVVAAAIVGEPTSFSWAGMAAAALGTAGTARSGLPSSALNSLGPNGASFAQNLEGGLVNGTLDSALSQALGDQRVPSWQQIGIDAFGNALGNAAASALNHASETQAPQQADTQSAANQYQGFANWLSGNDAGAGSDWQGPPYLTPNAGGNAATASTAGSTSEAVQSNVLALSAAQIEQVLANAPELAAADPYAMYAGVNGLPGSVDVTVPLLAQQGPTQAALLDQLTYDAKWMNYAASPGVTVQDANSISAAQDAYNTAAGSDTQASGGQYDAALVLQANDAIDTMIENNSWSFGPDSTASNVETLGTITVTASAGNSSTSGPYLMMLAPQTMGAATAGVAMDGVGMPESGTASMQASLWLGAYSGADLKDTAEQVSSALEVASRLDFGAAQIGGLSILNRAGALQQTRMNAIADATSFEELNGIVGDASQTGQWIAKLSPMAKMLEPAAVLAEGAYLYADVQRAPSNQVPLVIAQDTTSFAAEMAAAEGGALIGMKIGKMVAPFFGLDAPFVVAAFGIAGGLGGFAAYNYPGLENDVKTGVSWLVNGADNVIENPQVVVDYAKTSWNGFKSDTQVAINYLKYELSYTKGSY